MKRESVPSARTRCEDLLRVAPQTDSNEAKSTRTQQKYLHVLDASRAGCLPACMILLCLSCPPPVLHCEAFISVPFSCRQGRGRRAHACDPVWLHHALGHLEQHPEEGPEPALPDGLWMQGKSAEDCVWFIPHSFPSWRTKPDITDKQLRGDMSHNNSCNNTHHSSELGNRYGVEKS